jgi:hypothetical protein
MSRKNKKLYIPNYLFSNNQVIRKMFYQFLTIKQEYTDGSEVPKFYHDEGKHDDIICALALAASYFSARQSYRGFYGAGIIR